MPHGAGLKKKFLNVGGAGRILALLPGHWSVTG